MARYLSPVVNEFDQHPNSALVDIPTACLVLNRSRQSIYRHFQAGELTKIKVGGSTKIKVGELRNLMGVAQ